MTFEECIEIIITEYEKGYVNDPKDPGGETNFGISKKSYPNLDIKNLTRDRAIQIYKSDFWDKYHVEQMPENLRLMYFDSIIQHGPDRAMKLYNLSKSSTNVAITYAKLRLDFYQGLQNWEHDSRGWSDRVLDVALRSVSK